MSELFRARNPAVRRSKAARRKLLAVASGGGHWIQLLRIGPAFRDCDVTFVTTHASYRSQVHGHRFLTVTDSNLSTKFRLLKTAAEVAWIILTERPDIVVSTGAAPGYFALRLGHLMGAKTIWLDSIANVDQLSVSGRRIGRCADLWLTQWPDLAKVGGPYYVGSVL